MSIEDGFHEDDWHGFAALTSLMGTSVQVVGDDLTVTNPARIARAVEEEACNALLLKVNQIGTVSEALRAAAAASNAGWNVMVSHRSGETEGLFPHMLSQCDPACLQGRVSLQGAKVCAETCAPPTYDMRAVDWQTLLSRTLPSVFHAHKSSLVLPAAQVPCAKTLAFPCYPLPSRLLTPLASPCAPILHPACFRLPMYMCLRLSCPKREGEAQRAAAEYALARQRAFLSFDMHRGSI